MPNGAEAEHSLVRSQNALRKQLCEQSSSIKTGHLESMHKAHEVAVWGSRMPPRMQPQDVVPPRCPVCTVESKAQLQQ